MSRLRDLIANEIARRDNSVSMLLALCFVISNKPGAITDTATAVAAIIEHAEESKGDLVSVARAIGEQVADALERKFPKRTIISSPITSPGQSQRERGRLVEQPELDPVRIAEAADRAAERMERMRTNAR
jgi:hypothetical protein